jgi:hypothetical protein
MYREDIDNESGIIPAGKGQATGSAGSADAQPNTTGSAQDIQPKTYNKESMDFFSASPGRDSQQCGHNQQGGQMPSSPEHIPQFQARNSMELSPETPVPKVPFATMPPKLTPPAVTANTGHSQESITQEAATKMVEAAQLLRTLNDKLEGNESQESNENKPLGDPKGKIKRGAGGGVKRKYFAHDMAKRGAGRQAFMNHGQMQTQLMWHVLINSCHRNYVFTSYPISYILYTSYLLHPRV